MSTAIYLPAILVFCAIGYSIGCSRKRGNSRRVDIILVIALVLSFYVHGIFSGLGPFHIFVSSILAGALGGILVGRLGPELRNDLPEWSERV